MPLLLNVSYEEKDEAKKLGAKWNPELKRWYAPQKTDYPKFMKWICDSDDYIVICDHLYVVEAIRECWKCKKLTRVITFAVDEYFEFDSSGIYSYRNTSVRKLSSLSPFPESLLAFLIFNDYNYQKKFSKSINQSYLANCCERCDALQGDFYLHNEPDSPFVILDKQDFRQLKFYKLKLKYDIAVENNISDFSDEYDAKQLAQFMEVNIRI